MLFLSETLDGFVRSNAAEKRAVSDRAGAASQRVADAAGAKFAAELQHDQVCANPVMIRIETRAGHGAENRCGCRSRTSRISSGSSRMRSGCRRRRAEPVALQGV
jgi:hypothetical protein